MQTYVPYGKINLSNKDGYGIVVFILETIGSISEEAIRK